MGNEHKLGYIAFDVDGTLYSTDNILLLAYEKSINFINKKLGTSYNLPDKDALFSLVGFPYHTIYKTLFPDMDKKTMEIFGDSLRTELTKLVESSKEGFFGDVKAICTTLKKMNIGLLAASNGNIKYVKSVLNKANVLDLFEDLITVDYIKYHNKSEIVKEYLQIYGDGKNNWLMVGDRSSDYQAAVDNNIKFVAVLYGHGSSNEFPKYDYALNSLDEIIDVAKKNWNI